MITEINTIVINIKIWFVMIHYLRINNHDPSGVLVFNNIDTHKDLC